MSPVKHSIASYRNDFVRCLYVCLSSSRSFFEETRLYVSQGEIIAFRGLIQVKSNSKH